MSNIQLTLIPQQTKLGLPYQLLRILIDNPIVPSDLENLKLPGGVDCTQGVVIEGKGPIWLYAYLTHELHPTSWIGCYDPRLGAIVVESHNREVKVGTKLEIEIPT